MSNIEFTISVNNHNINITSQPEIESLNGRRTPSGFDMYGEAWIAEGEWIAKDELGEVSVPVTLYWKTVSGDDAEGSAVDWDNPWLIIPTEDDYLANPANGEVDTSEGWEEQFAQNPDWGRMEDAELVRVEPNIPDQYGYDDSFGDWRNA